MLEKFGIEENDFEDDPKVKESLLKETQLHISKNRLLSKTMLKMKSALLEQDHLQLKHELKE